MSILLLWGGGTDLFSVTLFCRILNIICMNSRICMLGSGFLQLQPTLNVCTAELLPGFML